MPKNEFLEVPTFCFRILALGPSVQPLMGFLVFVPRENPTATAEVAVAGKMHAHESLGVLPLLQDVRAKKCVHTLHIIIPMLVEMGHMAALKFFRNNFKAVVAVHVEFLSMINDNFHFFCSAQLQSTN